MGGCIVQPGRTERPMRYCGGAVVQATPVMIPSMVECNGRTTSVSWSAANGDIIVGGDVAPPQRWNEALSCFTGFSAGASTNGSQITYSFKKTVACQEGPSYAIWLAGAGGSGGIMRRTVGSGLWTLSTTTFFGEVDDGGSSDPRRVKARCIVIDGTTVYVACRRTASPIFGVARSIDSGANFTAWSFGTTRNYTALFKSPQYNSIYASADNRAGGGNDGVYIIATADGSVQRIDNIGTGAPTIADARDVYVVREGTTDCLFVVVGNAAGSDADRGIWRCRINADPNGGGFGAGNITWSHIYTPGTSDRINCVVAYKPNGNNSGPIYVLATYFKSSTNSSGTYALTPGAGGGTSNYRVTAVRTLNADAASPTFDVISGSGNVDITTYGTQHPHIMTYIGEAAPENGRFGGTNYSTNDLGIAPNGQVVVAAGKASPWICKNPWGGTPLWRPLSKGLGLLEGDYGVVQFPATTKSAVTDDDRGAFTWASQALGYDGPAWCASDDADGISGLDNACQGASVDYDDVSLLLARSGDGHAYRVTNPTNYNAASASVLTSATTGFCMGIYSWKALSANRRIQVNHNAIWRGATQVATISSTANRCDAAFTPGGTTGWIHVPDVGIYRTTDEGATWQLWWTYAISNGTTNRFCGHVALSIITDALLYATFDAGGVWRCTDADISATGSGLSGSRPGGTSLIIGGDLPFGTEPISAIAVDQTTGELWACGYSNDGTAVPKLYVKPPGSDAWKAMVDSEYGESCTIPQSMTANDGRLLIGTASQGTLRRMG